MVPLTTRLPGRLARVAAEAQKAVAATTPVRLLAAFAAAVVSWLLEAGALWSVAQAADVPVTLTVAAAATAFAVAFQGFQVTPGGIGMYEASLTGALSLYGVEPYAALTLAVATHALKFAYSFAAGIPSVLAEGLDAFGLGLFPAPLLPTPSVMPGSSARPGWLLADPRVAVGVLAATLSALATPFAGWVMAPLGMAALALGILARQWRVGSAALARPEAPPPGSVLAVLIPAHNEAATIGGVVAGVPRAALGERGVTVRVIVVDDGSADDTAEMARAAGADSIVRHPERRGLGAALRWGMAAARAEGAGAAVYLDGDGEYDPADIPSVAGPVLRGEADYVLGVRFPGGAGAMRPSRLWGNRAFTALLCVLTGRRIRDGQTGFRAFGRRA
ncbi:MAG: glycosyltransferase, partial [Chloroflexi bacterium]|nr:glycosyltransferase [Chloroflexota bacterium]